MAKADTKTSVWDTLRTAQRKISDARERLTRETLLNPTSYEMLSLDLKDAADAALEISHILRRLEA
jgi:hypothetical protein